MFVVAQVAGWIGLCWVASAGLLALTIGRHDNPGADLTPLLLTFGGVTALAGAVLLRRAVGGPLSLVWAIVSVLAGLGLAGAGVVFMARDPGDALLHGGLVVLGIALVGLSAEELPTGPGA